MTDFTPDPPLFPGQRPADRQRRWTPWRMQYVAGDRLNGCVFCHHFADEHDHDNLVLWRNDHAFVAMNLYPYGTGHTMIIPGSHISSPEEASETEAHAVADLLPPVLRATRRVLGCTGFNVGYNIGSSAGAGIAAHLHQHVVPRWEGDSNFLPVMAGVQALPELIPVTYAKLRAELVREMAGDNSPGEVVVAVAGPDGRTIAATADDGSRRLPTVTVAGASSLASAAIHWVAEHAANPVLTGWAGEQQVRPDERPVLSFVGSPREMTSGSGFEWVDSTSLSPEDARRLERARANARPAS